VTEGEDATVQRDQPAGLDPVVDGVRTNPGIEELGVG